MASRLESRIKRLEALKGDDVEEILDALSYEQGIALLHHLVAVLEGDGPSDATLARIPLSRARYDAALASIPLGVPERFTAAFVARVGKAEHYRQGAK